MIQFWVRRWYMLAAWLALLGIVWVTVNPGTAYTAGVFGLLGFWYGRHSADGSDVAPHG